MTPNITTAFQPLSFNITIAFLFACFRKHFCFHRRRSLDCFASYDNDVITKGEFYPTLNKTQLFPDYIALQSGHSRGSTLDLTLVSHVTLI